MCNNKNASNAERVEKGRFRCANVMYQTAGENFAVVLPFRESDVKVKAIALSPSSYGSWDQNDPPPGPLDPPTVPTPTSYA